MTKPAQQPGLDDPAFFARVKQLMREGLNRSEISAAVGMGEFRFRDLRARAAAELAAEAELQTETHVEGEGRRVEQVDGCGRADTGLVAGLINSDRDLLERARLNPDVYEIDRTRRGVEHTDWDQGAKVKKVTGYDAEGEPIYGQVIDVTTLHRFAFDFREIGSGPAGEVARDERVYAKWAERLAAVEAPVEVPGHGKKVAYFLGIGDEQIGKPKTEETIAGVKRAVLGHIKRIAMYRSAGYNIGKIVVGKGGDGCENVVNNYRAQPTETAGWDLTQQMDLYEDLCLWILEQLAPLCEDVEIWFVPSNHGEWTRNGGKDPVTSYRDNVDIKIGLTLKRFLKRIPNLAHINVVIAGEELTDEQLGDQLGLEHDPSNSAWCVLRDVCGTLTYLSHGYLEKGQLDKKVTTSREGRMVGTIQRQMFARRHEMSDLKLVVVFHYHHKYEIEFEGVTVSGEAACEAFNSSEYMRRFGVWSHPGVSGRLVGSAMGPRGHGEHTVL